MSEGLTPARKYPLAPRNQSRLTSSKESDVKGTLLRVPDFLLRGVGPMVRVLGGGRPLQAATRSCLLEAVRRKFAIGA